MSTEPKSRGAPTAYKPEYAAQAAKLCALGATDMELADFFEVDTRTIYRWKHANEDFCQAVIAGKDQADARVERALYNRAVGYSYQSEKIFNEKGTIIRAPVVEHVPPDTGAAFNWLKNRKPAEWRDKITQEHTGPDGGPLKVVSATMTPQQAAEAYAATVNGEGG
ncbi:helix-turn-helix domain-containing protein [Bosea sp. AS-1]|uniref:helix-turn-helix domain-containing protein n=1 Tax=Bosea sp. AS-1 TaxID=2015316 RepID=UPI000B773411|nr:helix-turn-helix domain-containing protein [Bosea sp. AS-1]